MSFPRYPKYKDSGVEWLGEVPEHWEVERIGYLSTKIGSGKTPSGGAETYADEGIVFIRSQNVYDEGLFLDDVVYITAETDEQLSASRVCEGDILLNITGASIGRTCLLPTGLPKANVNQHVCIVRLKDTAMRHFVALAMKSVLVKEQIDAAQTGAAREGLNFAQISKIVVPIPSPSEQATIAEFLDRETGKIDELVAEQQRLMELLKEKRQAVISHAVTKGLNPRAPMKPSGIEWLGDVPAHWGIRKLGHVCKLRAGYAFSASDFGNEGVVVVRMNNLRRGRLDVSDAARIPESACNPSAVLSAGDLVWGMSGSTGETGSLGNYARVCEVDLPCQLNQRMGRFATEESFLSLDYLEYVIQTPYFYEQVMLLVTGTAQSNISAEQVQSCIVTLPPVTEQVEIARHLVEKVEEFDKTNSIAWTAHFFAELHDAGNKKVFDSVLVVSDRNVIDSQLQDALFDFQRTTGVVANITKKDGSKSSKLAEALSGDKKIVVCTIQTFPFAIEEVRKLAATQGKRFAVIADEAHSSQAGDAAARLKAVLSPEELADLEDGGEVSAEDILTAQMSARASESGITYVAFTATPKAKTMELFGTRPDPSRPAGPDNLPIPFHVYSMRQAIEEKFILDVLANYTPYRLAFRLAHEGKDYDESTVADRSE